MDPFTIALLGSTAISAGGSILGGMATSRAGKAAYKDAQTFRAEDNRYAQAGLAPYQRTGLAANEQLNQIFNNGGGLDVTPYIDSPQYRFLQQEGENALLRNKSAMGRLASGETQRDLTAYGQGLASTQFDNYVNRLFGLAGIGQNALGMELNVRSGNANSVNQMGAMNAGYQADAAQSIYGGVANAANAGIQNALFANLLGQGGLMGGSSSYNNPALIPTPPLQGA